MSVRVEELEDSGFIGAREAREALGRQVLIQALLLGILADSAVRNAASGYGWTVWILALALATLILTRQRGAQLSAEQAAWLTVSAASAAAYAWRDAEILQAANVAATLVALAMFAMSSAGAPAASLLSSRIRDVLAGFIYAARDAIWGAIPLLGREAGLHAAASAAAGVRLPAVRAALLTLPLLAVFASLLASADPVFGSLFHLPGVRVDTALSHVFMVGFFAWASAGWMRGALLARGNRAALPDGMPFTLRAIDVRVSLGALVALFALFVGLQVRWLFGGAEVVLATTGLSLAEYARKGFFELVWVAALVLPLILVSRAAVGADAVAIRQHRQLSLALLVLLAAIMASALLRMRLYVSHFGLTTDRLYAVAFMGWLAVVFAGMAATVLRGWLRPFATVAVSSGLLALAALNVLNPDAVVARANLDRRASALPVDYDYLSRLSGAAAVIVAHSLASAQPAPATCRAAKMLRERWTGMSPDDARSNWGAARGRAAVVEQLNPRTIRTLCQSPED